MQTRINWVNNLKVLGIFAIILGHINSPLSAFIFSWHIPLFFIISGFFIKFDLTFKYFITKDFKKLFIPYFFFGIFGLIAEIIKRYILHRDSLNIIDELKGIFIWMDYLSLMNAYGFVLWFLPVLFFARLTLFLINKYIQNILIQLIVVSILFSISFLIYLPFGLDNAFNALIFVFIGNIFFKFYQDNKLLYILPFTVLALYVYFGIPNLNIGLKSYSNILVNILFSSSIVYVFVIFFKKVNIDNKVLTIWGRSTMFLFIIHPYTNNIAHIFVEKINFGDWYLKFFVSLALLQVLLFIKFRFDNRGIFKYV